MKHLFLILALFCMRGELSAQLFKEWFRQKQTQKEYLITQIAALQLYAEYVEKGYTIAKDGLGMIGRIKKGDLNMHSGYFNSLMQITPAVRVYGRVADIIGLQLEVVTLHKNTIRKIKSTAQFNAEELRYIEHVYDNLLSQSNVIMDQLIEVSTAGQLEMKDDERLKRIDGQYAEMKGVQEFAQIFFSQAQSLAIQRQKEHRDIQSSRQNYGLK